MKTESIGHRTNAKKTLNMLSQWLATRPLLTELTFTALTVLFGMQMLRTLVPSTFWILGNRMGWDTTELTAIGVLVIAIAFLAGPLSKLLGNHRLVITTASGLGLTRLLIQLWWGEPIFNLSLAIIGTALFFIFMSAYLENSRIQGDSAIHHFALGLLVGLALDTAINGVFKTYDTVWQTKPLPVLLTLLLLLIQLALVASIIPRQKSRPRLKNNIPSISISKSLTLTAIGPFLFLELIVFQNIPRLTTVTNWPLPLAFTMILLSQLAGLAFATWLLSKNWRILWPWALGSGTVLTISLALGYQKPALTPIQLFLGQILVSALVVMVLMGIATNSKRRQLSGIPIANGIGILLLITFIFVYYAVYDISLPFKNTLLEPAAGFIVASCALGATASKPHKIRTSHNLWTVPTFALILLILPLSMAIAWRAPTSTPGDGFPVRVMTYNLHNGFNTKGKLDLEAIAKVIEASKPDIVALQEVSRSWMISGRVDMLVWLSQRLHMPYVFGPTADPFWGNALLSRYPILAYSKHDLPPEDLLIKRGFITALIDLGKDEKLKVIATNFHHFDENGEIRQLQSKAILKFLATIDVSRTVLLGNFNAEPDEPEIHILQQARLIDTGTRISSNQASTFPSDRPYKRIDYIFISQDLQTIDIRVPFSSASDHLPVVADLGYRRQR